MKNRFSRFTTGILLLSVATFVGGFMLYQRMWVGFLVMIPIWGAALSYLAILYRRNAHKIAFMFDAIDNDDFAFRFTTQAGKGDKRVNEALNRIIALVQKAKQDAIQKEKYYELILNSVSTGVIVLEGSGVVFQTNAEAHRLLGLNVFTHVSQLTYVDEKLRRLVEQIGAGEKRQITIANERGTVNLSLRSSEMLLREKHVRILAINDIHSELEEREIDAWIRLTRVLTHEIMNSITPIMSLSEKLLSIQGTMDTTVRDGLALIQTTCNGLVLFVDSYRRFTHIPAPKPSLFYVAKFFDQMVQLAQHQTIPRRIAYRKQIIPADLILYADENLISQVVLNLLCNAAQAIGCHRTDGEITLRAYCNENESVVIEVSNNGVPIPAEEADHIFIPFFTTKEGGSGVGLSISRQIMRLSGGALTLKSAPGAAQTTFLLLFP